MNKEFADWYRTASLEPKGETLEARWKAIEKFVAKAEPAEMLDIVRLFLGVATANKAVIDKFADGFRKADAAFPATGNEVELRVLAGAACVACFENAEDWERPELVALAVTAGGYRQRRKNMIVPRIFELCETVLVDRSSRRFEDAKNGADLSAAAAELKKVCTGTNVGQHMEKQLGAFLDRLEEKIESNDTRQMLLQEEANVLWWLFGSFSRDLKLPFDKIEGAALPLVAGNELAALIEVRPGPVAFPGLLARVLNGTQQAKYSLAEAVNTVSKPWREAIRAKTADAVLDLCPVRMAVARSLEVPDAKSWIKPMESVAGIPLNQKVDALDLAIQSLREALLHQYVDEGANA